MNEPLSEEIGFLRTIVKNLERSLIPLHPEYLSAMRAQGREPPTTSPMSKTAILPGGRDAFNRLCECFMRRPLIARGASFANLQNELFAQIETYAGRDPTTIVEADARRLIDHFDAWFTALAIPRRIFVPCVLTPWPAPSFSIGSVTFVHLDEISKQGSYTDGPTPDALSKQSFNSLLKLMNDTRAYWLARVEVEGCEPQRAEEVGELSVDLAIVALQLAAPNFDTSGMSRLDSRRGASQKQVLSEANGLFGASWTRKEPGLAIGRGTLAEILHHSRSVADAVGNVVRSFSTGAYRLPKLESAWCDGAYWLHEALSEPIDNIAIAKLETALEVLLGSENGSGSTQRLLAILECFFELQPGDPISPGSALTAKQFATNLVRDRSRILHGTWSTLNERLGRSREGMAGFVITVIRRAVVELEAYIQEPSNEDSMDTFIEWLKQRPTQECGNR
ncbi:hypothetical protein FHT85_004973 [Rhizobium sp. BK312]|uniref:hypothetical protein n=1 Tax=Rhizobium sp. BK312 TaxID=2587080 RepID=UPI0013AF7D02|nr:hypothetical protein [Rhizobium sp. BK312]MBB3427964.1 hypothetical protein [Rhizobium sp. BK312]